MTLASPALAQSDDLPSGKNSVTVGVGVASVPRFDGASDNSIEPAFGVQGSIKGRSFSLQETALTIDLIKRKDATGGKLIFGPLIHASLNRNSNRRTRDLQVIALGQRGIAVEVGGQVGFSQNGVLTSPYDNVTFRVSYVKDVTGTHDSFMLTPAISYGTPLSKGSYVGASISADYVGGRYLQTYFGVTPTQAQASGLTAFTPASGFKDVNLAAVGLVSLSGDLRHGLGVFAFANYSKLVGDAARSPVPRSSNQLSGALGLAYTF